MRKILLSLFLLIISIHLEAQQSGKATYGSQRYISKETVDLNITIYPVPVRNNEFTIKTNKKISFIKVTNIIGQDIYRFKYNDPQPLVKISLENPQRGMYLVTIIFSDGSRVVKKIMIEES